MSDWAALLEAIAGFAWPVAFVAVAVLFRVYIRKILERESVTIKVAGMELSAADAAKQAGMNMAELTKRVSEIEAMLGTPPERNVPAKQKENAAPSVLWVDDYPENNAFLIQQFERDGVKVRKEISTSSGVSAVKEERFDAIISDLGRKENGVDNRRAGLEFVNQVRGLGIKTPILIFAGQRGLDNASVLKDAGANEVTASPTEVFRFVTQSMSKAR